MVAKYTYKVTDGLKQDAGKNIVRLTDNEMEKLHLKDGDIIGINGGNYTAATVYSSEAVIDGIRMGSVSRGNAGVDIGGTVEICKDNPILAETIYLQPVMDLAVTRMRSQFKQMKKSLNDYVITLNDIILIGELLNPLLFKVVEISPKEKQGIYTITEDTKIELYDEVKIKE